MSGLFAGLVASLSTANLSTYYIQGFKGQPTDNGFRAFLNDVDPTTGEY